MPLTLWCPTRSESYSESSKGVLIIRCGSCYFFTLPSASYRAAEAWQPCVMYALCRFSMVPSADGLSGAMGSCHAIFRSRSVFWQSPVSLILKSFLHFQRCRSYLSITYSTFRSLSTRDARLVKSFGSLTVVLLSITL